MSDLYPYKIDPADLPFESGFDGHTANITPILDDPTKLARWYAMNPELMPESIVTLSEYEQNATMLSDREMQEYDLQITDMLRVETEAQVQLVEHAGATTVNPEFVTWPWTPEGNTPGLMFRVDRMPARMKLATLNSPPEVIEYIGQKLADYATLAAADARTTDQPTVIMLKDIFKLGNWSFDPEGKLEPIMHDPEPELGDFALDYDLFRGTSAVADDITAILGRSGYINLSVTLGENRSVRPIWEEIFGIYELDGTV